MVHPYQRSAANHFKSFFLDSSHAGISSILFETRLGCLQEEVPKDTLRFINAVNEMLSLSETLVVFPRWSRGILPFWERFVQAWDDLYDIGTQRRRKEGAQ